jgi:hypothetical protein
MAVDKTGLTPPPAMGEGWPESQLLGFPTGKMGGLIPPPSSAENWPAIQLPGIFTIGKMNGLIPPPSSAEGWPGIQLPGIFTIGKEAGLTPPPAIGENWPTTQLRGQAFGPKVGFTPPPSPAEDWPSTGLRGCIVTTIFNPGLPSVLAEGPGRVLLSTLAPGAAGFLLIADTAYFVFIGRLAVPTIPKFVEFQVSVAGVGSQTAEVGLFSTPLGPNKGGQVLTKLVSTGTVDSLISTGMKRNTAAFATEIPIGTFLWAGVRTNMGTTQPTVWGLGLDNAEGMILATTTAGVLTAAGPWTGSIIAAVTTVIAPDIRITLD